MHNSIEQQSFGNQSPSIVAFKGNVAVTYNNIADNEADLYIDDNSTAFSNLSQDKFTNLIQNWSCYLQSCGYRFKDIANYAWDTIVYDSLFALKIQKEIDTLEQELRKVILPLCKIANDHPIQQKEVLDFIDSLHSEPLMCDGIPAHEHLLLIARFIKYLTYKEEEYTVTEQLVERLENLMSSNEEFWTYFFVDLFYRHLCGYITIGDIWADKLSRISKHYINENPNEVLSKLYPFISTPYNFYRKHQDVNDLIMQIRTIAVECENPIEGRWAISCLSRILPLYKYASTTIEYSDIFMDILGSIKKGLILNSPFLQFLYLTTLLKNFLTTHDISILKKMKNLVN